MIFESKQDMKCRFNDGYLQELWFGEIIMTWGMMDVLDYSGKMCKYS